MQSLLKPNFVSKVTDLKIRLIHILLKVFALLILPFGIDCHAQSYLDLAPSYIDKHKHLAIAQMVQYKIPASVILAQAIKESGSGCSYLAENTHNHFGIKCHREWGGNSFNKDDDTLNECFRSYYSVEDSYLDHSLFLMSRPRYAFLLDLKTTDYSGWCYGLKMAGYATSAQYAKDLIDIIEKFQLFELDRAEQIKTHAPDQLLALFPDKEITKTSDLVNFLSAEKGILAKVVFNQDTEEEVLLVSTTELAKNAE